ncbi:MAG TPA: hypothetical protein VFX16_19585 [Pseudonocardiaceae bacterium]|nr:hypothetical protein [Pseudonocardiaceae bacterium]
MNPDDRSAKHPNLLYWLTGGLAVIVAVIIGVSVVTSGPDDDEPATGAGVPTALQGAWQGILTYPGTPTVKFSLSIGSGTVGSKVGEWLDQTRECKGDIYLRTGGGRQVLLHLVTTANALDMCTPEADARASLEADTLLTLRFDPTYGATPHTGTLHRNS